MYGMPVRQWDSKEEVPHIRKIANTLSGSPENLQFAALSV